MLQQWLSDAVSRSGSPGAVACVGDLEHTHFLGAHGLRQTEPSAEKALPDTLYDLGSVTKAVATTTAALLLHEEGALDLDQPVETILPFPRAGRMTVRQLFQHTSGLPAWGTYYRTASSVWEVLGRVAEEGLASEPGEVRRYSDVGFMALGKVVELAAGEALDSYCRRRVFAPAGMEHTTFRPPLALAARAAPTERCVWRKELLQGVVHDENAYALGGVAGHAGLFSTASDLARFCRALLGGHILRAATLDEALRLGQFPAYPWQGLGWELDPWPGGSAGHLPSRLAFGHAGWPGASVWMDRAKGFFAVLLSNTCHPARSRRDNRNLRRRFHTGVAKTFYPNQSNVHTGLDRLVRSGFAQLRGKRVALLTHHAAVDQMNRHILDVLRLRDGVDLRVIYTPEHGLRGQTEAGEHVAGDQRAPVPVVSLYGERRRPTREELDGIDLLVVDLQDIGARYYTYIATMLDCLEVCGQTRTAVLVLDRPNPIGGVAVEGPVAEDTGSLVCCAPIPVRHGLTIGETAAFFVDHVLRERKPDLEVARLDGWRRDLLFSACQLPWTPPSPNIPTPETALVYVGTCLFEGTNLNEGRGTDEPFFLVGAPWLDPGKVLSQLDPGAWPGCRLEAATYTPRSIPGKANRPRWLGETCRGLRVHIQNPNDVRAFAGTVALLQAIVATHGDTLEFSRMFDLLAGGKGLRGAIEAGTPLASLQGQWQAQHTAFARLTKDFYPLDTNA